MLSKELIAAELLDHQMLTWWTTLLKSLGEAQALALIATVKAGPQKSPQKAET